MSLLLWVGIGGALGACARYTVYVLAQKWLGSSFPYATLFVNTAGSALMGLLSGTLALKWHWSSEVQAMVFVGMLGAFTTFSTFTLDVATLYQRNSWIKLMAYTSLSCVLPIAGMIAGLYTVRLVMTKNS